jgi:hypothetical protein
MSRRRCRGRYTARTRMRRDAAQAAARAVELTGLTSIDLVQ